MKIMRFGDRRVDFAFGDITVRAERSAEGATSPVIIWPDGKTPTIIQAPHPRLDDDLTHWALAVLARHVAGLPQR